MLLASHLMPNIKPHTYGSWDVTLQVDAIKHKKYINPPHLHISFQLIQEKKEV